MDLSYDNPTIFNLYLNHVYTGQPPTMTHSKREIPTLCDNTFMMCIHSEYDLLVSLYILAEKLQDTLAKHAAIEAMHELSLIRYADGD